MQSTGHSSMQALSFRSTHGWAMTYVTSGPPVGLFNRPRRSCAVWCRAERQGGCPSPLLSISDVAGVADPGWGSYVGSRVVVRLRRGTGFRDILGELVSFDNGALRILTKSGDTVSVAVDDVV